MKEASPLQNADNDRYQYGYYMAITMRKFDNKADYKKRHSITIGYLIWLANTAINSVSSNKGLISIEELKK